MRSILASARQESINAEERLSAAERLLGERERVEEWLAADPAHPKFLLTDPRSALQEAIPGIELPDLNTVGHELVAQLVRNHETFEAGVLTYTPPEGLAVELLRAVANDAGSTPGGYSALFSDIQGTVTRVEAGQYGADVITRVVNGIYRGIGLTPPSILPTTKFGPAPPTLASYLDQHPEAREFQQ
jgi:hypothetical protein